MTPKSMLRSKAAASSAAAFTEGRWEPVLGDPRPPAPAGVRRIVLCSGKVTWPLTEQREQRGRSDTAIVRIEQLYPLPFAEIAAAVGAYPNAEEILWVQEEPANMGAWTHIAMHLPNRLGRTITPVTRPESSSPATGSHLHSEQEHDLLLSTVFPE
jgi:2-oxoglutarate dehydrogenase complex dehydrogenase (E1) component-like enzyme